MTRAVEEEIVEHRRERLSRLAARTRYSRAHIVILRGEAGSALVQEAARGRYDLVIRSHRPAHAGGPLRPFGPTDLRLLRECPRPVWLVGPPLGRRRGPVIAALDASDTAAASLRLEKQILDLALEMRDFLGSAS